MDEGFAFPRELRIRLTQAGYKEICKMVDERDGEKCVICGSHWAIHHHHVRFRSAYGSDTLNNLVDVCARCHGVYCHGVNEKRWKTVLQDYLGSDKVKEWNEKHSDEAEKIYTKCNKRKHA